MKKENRVHKGFSLERNTIAEIKLKAIQEGTNDSRAKNCIVAEYIEMKLELSAYKNMSEPSYCTVSDKVYEIDKQLEEVLRKLRLARL